ncbi:MAG: hypothetical protein M3Q44_08405 [bacterium]|nr:hypothetical protein [bacterium]
MQKTIFRVSTAVLIAVTASVGVQKQPVPPSVVLSAQIEAIPSSEVTKEATSSQAQSLAVVAIQAPSPIAEETPIPEAQLISEEEKQNEKNTKVLKLQKFLSSYNSPMAGNAQDFVEAAEQYNLDWKLVPAIAGVESTFGKHLIPGSHNAYGWGGGKIRFESWREGIYTISKGLAEKYAARGLITPHQIQPVYAPPSLTWGNKVTFFMNKLDQTLLEEPEPIATEDK